MSDVHFGWNANPAGVERWLAARENRRPLFATALDAEPLPAEPVLLYEPLVALLPQWVRGYQGIGDCVSWGWELACTLILAIRIVIDRRLEGLAAPVATESIYGGSRVEGEGQATGGWSDGSYGAAAARWLTGWGAVLRRDYSQQTGNAEHDLRSYSATRAKAWGHYGNGGRDDKGKLDAVARVHPVRTASLCRSFAEAARAIAVAKKPVAVCSTVGFQRQRRDAAGFLSPAGYWAHCMCFAGYRGGGRPGLLCVNSHPPTTSGPRFPETMPAAVAGVSWWVDAEVCDRMLAAGDSFAVSDLEGWEPERLPDFATEEFL